MARLNGTLNSVSTTRTHQFRLANVHAPRVLSITFDRGVEPSTIRREDSLLPGFEIETAYVPVREFRGDFVLTRRLRGRHDNAVLLVIGDVSGKGARTSLAVSRLIFAIDEMAEGIDGPGDLLEKLNRAMRDRLNGEMATCTVVQIHRTGECSLASAGHPLPLVNGREVHLHSGVPLGLVANGSYAETAITIEKGECLVLYTNGMTEARNEEGELFGEDRLRKMFSDRLSLGEITEKVKRFGQMDDLTVLTITRRTS
jgi:sigma-B regulation protein RsbU (phosphoserine phosphatase)